MFEEYGFAFADKTQNLLWSDSGDFQHSFFPDKERLWGGQGPGKLYQGMFNPSF